MEDKSSPKSILFWFKRFDSYATKNLSKQVGLVDCQVVITTELYIVKYRVYRHRNESIFTIYCPNTTIS